jgi:hypothetical protein
VSPAAVAPADDGGADNFDGELHEGRPAEPRWLNARGVTGNTGREAELGQGKWTEAARPLSELKAQLSDAPVRAMEIAEAGPPWVPIIAALAFLVVLAAWFAFRSDPEPETAALVVDTLPGASANVGVAVASPDKPVVTVIVDLPGAVVLLDGVSYGPTPATVPVPLDADSHELCADLGDPSTRRCRKVDGATLAASDPYRFEVGER